MKDASNVNPVVDSTLSGSLSGTTSAPTISGTASGTTAPGAITGTVSGTAAA